MVLPVLDMVGIVPDRDLGVGTDPKPSTCWQQNSSPVLTVPSPPCASRTAIARFPQRSRFLSTGIPRPRCRLVLRLPQAKLPAVHEAGAIIVASGRAAGLRRVRSTLTTGNDRDLEFLGNSKEAPSVGTPVLVAERVGARQARSGVPGWTALPRHWQLAGNSGRGLEQRQSCPQESSRSQDGHDRQTRVAEAGAVCRPAAALRSWQGRDVHGGRCCGRESRESTVLVARKAIMLR